MAGRRRGPHRRPEDAPPPPPDGGFGRRGGRGRGRGFGPGPGGPGFAPGFGPGGRPGPGPGGPGFGFGGPFGPGGPGGGWGQMLGGIFGRGPRARRGNVRSAILTLLAEQPHNGYQIMQAIEQRSHGQWRPSSGSIYPTLQQLEDEGLVETEEKVAGQSGSKTFKLTAKGKRYVDDNRDDLEAEWDAVGRGEDPSADPRLEMFNLFRQVATAAMQVAHSGTAKQLDEAKQLLNDTRRNLYRILAELPDDNEPENDE